jgi:hypothetical protein
MDLINRCVAVVKAKQSFLTWANGLPDGGAKTTLDRVNSDSHVYLLPEYAMDDEREELLREFYEVIFERELMGWCTDPRTHPTPRTFDMFLKWFAVEFHSMVFDLLDDEAIEHEPA